MRRWSFIAGAMMLIGVAVPAAAQHLPPGRELRISPQEASQVAPDRIRRVEADIASRIPQWRGVRSCNDAGRASNELRTALNAWIGEQVTANSRLRVLSHGWGAGTWWYRNRTSSSGSRSCRGGFSTAPVFVEFY